MIRTPARLGMLAGRLQGSVKIGRGQDREIDLRGAVDGVPRSAARQGDKDESQRRGAPGWSDKQHRTSSEAAGWPGGHSTTRLRAQPEAVGLHGARLHGARTGRNGGVLGLGGRRSFSVVNEPTPTRRTTSGKSTAPSRGFIPFVFRSRRELSRVAPFPPRLLPAENRQRGLAHLPAIRRSTDGKDLFRRRKNLLRSGKISRGP